MTLLELQALRFVFHDPSYDPMTTGSNLNSCLFIKQLLQNILETVSQTENWGEQSYAM